jgi:hypothetical protein
MKRRMAWGSRQTSIAQMCVFLDIINIESNLTDRGQGTLSAYEASFFLPGTAEFARSIFVSLIQAVEGHIYKNFHQQSRPDSCDYCIQRGALCIGHLGHARCLECKRKNQTCKTIGMGAVGYLKLLIKQGVIKYQGTDFTETRQFRPQDHGEREEQALLRGK